MYPKTNEPSRRFTRLWIYCHTCLGTHPLLHSDPYIVSCVIPSTYKIHLITLCHCNAFLTVHLTRWRLSVLSPATAQAARARWAEAAVGGQEAPTGASGARRPELQSPSCRATTDRWVARHSTCPWLGLTSCMGELYLIPSTS